MRFFDAHCDTIGKVWERGADFGGRDRGITPGNASDDQPGNVPGGQPRYHPGGDDLHVTLPGLRAAGARAQVFASWAWTERYRDREFEVAMNEVKAVRRLCEQYSDDLVLALTGDDISAACEANEPNARIAVIPSLEGSDALCGKVDNLAVFRNAGVRLVTIAWHDSPFCGSTYGSGTGLTDLGIELVEACEDAGILVDLSHSSDQTFFDVCRVATRPFIASHSNCRELCPSPRNLTDEMIREIAERGARWASPWLRAFSPPITTGRPKASMTNSGAPSRNAVPAPTKPDGGAPPLRRSSHAHLSISSWNTSVTPSR